MFHMFMITICLQSVPYGNVSDLVPNNYIKNTKISTGLFYSIRLPEHGNWLVSYKNNSGSNSQHPVLIGGNVQDVSDSNLFVFHPAHVGHTVKIFHKQLLVPVLLAHTYNYNRYIMMERSTFNYHLIRNNYSSRLSSSDKDEFMRHCRDSTFKLKENNLFYYELFNHDETEVIVYNPHTKELNSRSSSYSHPTLLKLVPMNYKLGAVITEFEYNDFEYSNLETLAVDVPSVQIWNFTNESYDLADSHTVEINEKVINTAEWSFSNSYTMTSLVEAGVEVSVEANFFFGSAKAAAHTKVSFGMDTTSLNSKTKTVTDETSFHVTSTIHVGPRQTTEYMLVWRKVDIELSFTAKVKLHAFADRINKDGSVSKMVRVDPEGVMALIEHKGFSGNITRNGNEIINYITGSVHVKRATKGQTRRRDFNFDGTSTPVAE